MKTTLTLIVALIITGCALSGAKRADVQPVASCEPDEMAVIYIGMDKTGHRIFAPAEPGTPPEEIYCLKEVQPMQMI